MKKQLFSRLGDYLKLIRVSNWLKNIFLFVPLIFSKQLLNKTNFLTVVAGFFIFSLASSLVYIINDISDSAEDSVHPAKRNRPIANGSIRKLPAGLFAAILAVIVFLTSLQFNVLFVAAVCAYTAVNILYSVFLKRIMVADILCIASGFLLRILAGAYIINVSVSNWLILTTIFISMFLAVMKRRVEIVVNPDLASHRSVLKQYSVRFLDQIAAVSGGALIFSYSFYTVATRTIISLGTKKLIFTIIFVIFGIFRYMYMVYKREIGENVIEALLGDLPMLVNLFLYVCSVIYIIYM